ncbi:hypothetical protein FZC66_14710 [Priestia megaterium]|nr:hypothetical protein FZC66_14710 [Priestia megaterium]
MHNHPFLYLLYMYFILYVFKNKTVMTTFLSFSKILFSSLIHAFYRYLTGTSTSNLSNIQTFK